MSDASEFQAGMEQVDALLNQVEATGDPASKARVEEIVRTLMDLHGLALKRLLDHIVVADAGPTILEAAARDDVVSPLLLLHGLHPLDLQTRVRDALARIAPYTASHGGHVELLSISNEAEVKLRMEGSCHGCPSSRVTLESTIEQEIYAAAPEVTSIVVDGLADAARPAAPTGFVPLDAIAVHGAVRQTVAS